MSVNVSRHPGRRARIAAARRAGLLDGMASVFRLSGRGRPAPVLARRRYGSLWEDGRSLQRDGERLFRGDAR